MATLKFNKQVSNLANIQRIIAERDLTDLDNRFSVRNLALKHGLSQEEANDLSKLLIDMAAMKFSFSHQLSDYIIKNKLSHQYPNIAGNVKMQRGSDKWDYKGGFSKEIYKIICNELKLLNKGTSARAISFVSHKDMQC
jgi:uncharacterized protein YeeX (DUF496 family)